MSYEKRIKQQERRIQRLENLMVSMDRRSRRLSLVRLFIFLIGFFGTFALYWLNKPISLYFLLGAAIAFFIVARIHSRVEHGLTRFKIWRDFAVDALARLTLNWPVLPKAKSLPVAEDHPFDRDLDLTGDKSVHQLLDICVTQQGSERLAAWLLTRQPEPHTIQHRQNMVCELKKQRRFRDKMRLNFRLVSEEQFSDDKVQQWLSNTKSLKKLGVLFGLALLLCLINITLVIVSLAGGPSYWGYGLLVYAVFILLNRDVWSHLGHETEFLDLEFKQSVAVFRQLENHSYAATPALAKLCAPFRDARHRPTRELRQFMLLSVLVGLRMNYLTAILLNLFFPYDFFCAFLLNRQKQNVSTHFQKWLDCLYELDALNCLANFADLNPNAVVPNIVDSADTPPSLTAQALGHPFIPEHERAVNNFTISGNGRTVLITGSNMSGKSTFLRTLGVNLVLVYSGAPVVASSFSTSLFRLFCCIQVNDSITSGVSQFYAEVKRLKKLQDELQREEDRPVFYLIDEIFKGTNNRERYIGSRSYILSLTTVRGLGCITTHDLDLTHLDVVKNLHFREHVENGRLVFDYKLHDGPCPTTNALKIMQLEGLPVKFQNENGAVD